MPGWSGNRAYIGLQPDSHRPQNDEAGSASTASVGVVRKDEDEFCC